MIRNVLPTLVAGRDLTREESRQATLEIFRGEAAPTLIAAFLTGLAAKGETGEEVAGAAAAMREMARPIEVATRPLLDTCGTGGDHSGTFNISTTAAFVVAGTGVRVAKHGNRSASSKSGSSEVLEALGVDLALSPRQVAGAIEEIGIGFLYAPLWHEAMRHAAPVRRELGIRTLFNLLGPLTNPAGAEYQVVGVARADLVERMAEALWALGTRRSLVVHGAGGVDELTLAGENRFAEVTPEGIRYGTVSADELGLAGAPVEALAGGEPAANARITADILAGRGTRAQEETVLLNAAAGVWAAGAAADLREGLETARRSLREGAAREKLERLRSLRSEGAGA